MASFGPVAASAAMTKLLDIAGLSGDKKKPQCFDGKCQKQQKKCQSYNATIELQMNGRLNDLIDDDLWMPHLQRLQKSQVLSQFYTSKRDVMLRTMIAF